MTRSLRSTLANVAPQPLKDAAVALREWLTPPPVDALVLTNYTVEADPDPKPRLTMTYQFLKKGHDFGGGATGIEVFSQLCLALKARLDIDVRLIVTNAVKDSDPTIFINHAKKAGLHVEPEQIELLPGKDDILRVRKNEVFFNLIWWNVLNLKRVRDQQAKLFDREPLPIIWLCQDYDPMFYDFSTGHMLARSAFDGCSPLWCVVNSASLAEFITIMGHRLERSFVFEPVISSSLRPYLDRVGTSERKKRLLVYGRANISRNCFSALIRGLRHWAIHYPEYSDWEVVSAGAAHDPIELGDGRKVMSVGKLSLDEYAEMLLTSSAGVSLMASPHPSYPPLEMAHFGLRTVTNSYLCKDLSDFHSNIISIPSIEEEALGGAIAEACARSSEPTLAEVNPVYVRTESYPFLGELADMFAGKFG